MDAVAPTDPEVDRASSPLPEELRVAAARATAPAEREAHRLVARMHSSPPSRRSPLWVVVPVAAAVLVGIGIGVREVPPSTEEATSTYRPAAVVAAALPDPVPDSPDTVAPAAGDTLTLGEAPVAIGPSVALRGDGVVTIERLAPRGPTLALAAGAVDVDVDPDGPQRALTLDAGDVRVRVLGTVFRVERDGAHVAVQVTRGRVEVEHGGEVEVLTAGGAWERPKTPAAPRTPQVPAPAPGDPREVTESAPAPEPAARPSSDVPSPPSGDATAEGPPESPSAASEAPSAEASAPPDPPPEPPVGSSGAPPANRARAAAAAFAVILDAADRGDPPATLRARLDDFLEHHGDSVLAAEARTMKERLDE